MSKDFLDEKLNTGKKEAERFFNKNIDSDRIRKGIYIRLSNDTPRKKNNGLLYGKISITIAACILLLLITPYLSNTFINYENKDMLGEPINQQLISLNEKANQLLNFFKIGEPDKKSSNLLAVLWNEDDHGDYRVVYSNLLENSDKPLPVSMILFPDNENHMALIASVNNRENYVHYRVIGYNDNEVNTYLMQDYVPNGEVTITDNVIKEKRIMPLEYTQEDSQDNNIQTITYYIAYTYNELGNLVLSTDHIRINKGEQIVIFGDNNNPVEVYPSELFFKDEGEDSLMYINSLSGGASSIDIKPKYGGVPQKLFVEVIDNEQEEY
jgi:hypothetical protein